MKLSPVIPFNMTCISRKTPKTEEVANEIQGNLFLNDEGTLSIVPYRHSDAISDDE